MCSQEGVKIQTPKKKEKAFYFRQFNLNNVASEDKADLVYNLAEA